VVWNVPVACNRASADFLVSSPLLNPAEPAEPAEAVEPAEQIEPPERAAAA
jgi:methylglyoxal synthase